MIRLAGFMVALLASVGAAYALSPAAQRGLTFVETNCSQCHAVGRHDASPLPIAPPMRTFHEHMSVESLRQPLMMGTISDHPSMPHFSLDAAQVDDVIAYLESLETSGE